MKGEKPNNLEAEQVVLAGVCIGTTINISEVDFGDFYDHRHKKLLEVIKQNEPDIPMDAQLVYNAVEKLGFSNEVGLEAYVIEVIDGKSIEAKYQSAAWLKKVKEESGLRKILLESKQLAHDIENSKLSNDEAKARVSALNFNISNKTNPKVKELVWVKPLAQEAFYGLVGEIVKTIDPHTEADQAALLFSFLTAFGNVVGNSPHIKVEADIHPPRIFTVIVGRSSKGRKGTSWGYIKKLFENVDPEWLENTTGGLSSGEGVIWAVRDEIIKKIPEKDRKITVGFNDSVEDPGIEDKRLLIIEGEFVQALKVMEREGNILSPLIRNSWDTGNLRTLTKNSPAKATNAHISIIGHITNQELLRYFRSTEQANGFGNRFLWVCVKRSKELPFGGDIEEKRLMGLSNKVKNAADFAKQCGEVNLTEEAKKLWQKIYSELSKEIPGLIGSLTGRSEAYVLRLSLIYALLDRRDQINTNHLMAALAVWHYAEDSVRYIFQSKTGNEDADKIRDGLIQWGRLSRSNISKKVFNGNKKSEDIDTALDILHFNNELREYSEATEGRDITYFELISGTNYELRVASS